MKPLTEDTPPKASQRETELEAELSGQSRLAPGSESRLESLLRQLGTFDNVMTADELALLRAHG